MNKKNKILCIIVICISLVTICICANVFSHKDEKSLDSYLDSLDGFEDTVSTEEIIPEYDLNTVVKETEILDSGNHYQTSNVSSIEDVPDVIRADYRWAYITESSYLERDPISVTVITYSDYYEVQIAYTDYYIMIVYNFDGSLFVAE